MGLFDKIKKSEKPQAADNSGPRTGFVLLKSDKLDWDALRQGMQREWGITFAEEAKEDSAVFACGDMMVAVSLLPAPVPGGEAEANAGSNYLWPQAAEAVKAHKAHILLAVLGGHALDKAALFVKTAAVLLRLPNAIAIYTAPTVHEAQAYVEMADMLKEKETLPVPLFIYLGIARTEKGLNGYTVGLDAFGKREIKVLDTTATPGDMYGFLCNMAEYVIAEDVSLQPGETIGFSAEEKLPITKSKGVFVEGESLKIGWRG